MLSNYSASDCLLEQESELIEGFEVTCEMGDIVASVIWVMHAYYGFTKSCN